MHILSSLIFGLFMVSLLTNTYQAWKFFKKQPYNKWALRISSIFVTLYMGLQAITFVLAGFLHMTYLIPGNYTTNTIAIFSVVFIVLTVMSTSNIIQMWNGYPTKSNEKKNGSID